MEMIPGKNFYINTVLIENREVCRVFILLMFYDYLKIERQCFVQ